jgi:hypothetical protein
LRERHEEGMVPFHTTTPHSFAQSLIADMTEEMRSPDTVTRLLLDSSDGDERARDEMLPLVYDELRRLAAMYLLRERRDHTLQPTALVHEAYLRLVDQRR